MVMLHIARVWHNFNFSEPWYGVNIDWPGIYIPVQFQVFLFLTVHFVEAIASVTS